MIHYRVEPMTRPNNGKPESKKVKSITLLGCSFLNFSRSSLIAAASSLIMTIVRRTTTPSERKMDCAGGEGAKQQASIPWCSNAWACSSPETTSRPVENHCRAGLCIFIYLTTSASHQASCSWTPSSHASFWPFLGPSFRAPCTLLSRSSARPSRASYYPCPASWHGPWRPCGP